MASLVLGLHERHVAHGDLKLENFLMLEDSIKLSDFGGASMFGDAEKALLFQSRWALRISLFHTRFLHHSRNFTSRRGTEIYESPEILMGRPADSRKVDVWALGCIFFELLTGGLALFPGRNECLKPFLVGADR